MDKHIILFLAANPHGTDRLALEREAHAIQAELERSGYRDCFDFVTRWAAEPLDILRELRKLRPTVVHFSGHGGEAASTLRSTCSDNQDAVGGIERQDGELHRGVLVHGANGGAHIVSGAALAETLGATGSSVKLVVLNACYNDPDAEALLTHVGCVVGVAGSVHHEAARSFAIGFYGGLGERESVDVAYKQGCAAISLGGLPDSDRPRLKVRHGVDPKQLVLAPRRHDLAQLVGMASATGSTACPYPGMRPFEAHQANVFFGRRREVNALLTRIDHGEREIYVYKEIGEGRSGLHIAIARHADAEFGKLTLARQTIARRVLLRLVSFGEGRPDTRRQQEIKALRSAAEDFVEFSCVLQQLIDARLVTVGHGEGADDALADLSHEAIITAWPTLQRWIERRRVDEQRRRRLDAKVSEWIERGRGNLSLLDAVELSEAIDWMHSDAAAELGYSSELPALVAESEVELEKERQLTREVRRLTEKSNLERGHSLLLKKQPMQAIPYLVAARAEVDERPVLRVLFGQAAESLPRVTFIGHESLLTGAAFSPDGKRVVTASCDRTAQIWDAITGEPIGPRLEHQSFVSTAMFSSDGTRIVTASHDHTAQIWDAVNGKAVASPLCHHGIVTSAVFNADGTRVLTASRDKTARIWNASTGEPTAAPLEHEDSVAVATFHPMGTSVVTASYHIAQIWNASNGAPMASPFKHENQVCVATFSPDGTFLLTASHDGITQVWNIATGSPITRPFKHKGPVVAAAFSLDGKRVVTASWDKTARVWDIARGEPVSPSLRHRGVVSVAAFSPDGTRVVTVSGDKTAKGEPGRTSRCLVRVWRASTGRPITPWLQHSAAVSTAVFSPDGARIATASWDRMARIWNISTNKPSFVRLEDREGDTAVIAAAFSSDGNRVVTASLDRIARVWDVPSGTLVTQLIEDRGFIWTAAFSSDGSRVVTATWDMTAWIGDPSTVAPGSVPMEPSESPCTGIQLNRSGACLLASRQ